MEANETNYSKDSDINDETDDATKIVSEVIHEYDVIDDPTSESRRKNNLQNETDLKNNHQVKNISAPQEIPHSQHSAISDQNYGESSSDVSNRNRLSSSDRSNSITESVANAVTCPKVNCKEKIVICLDISAEMEKQTFRSRAGDKFSPLQMLKRAMSLFLHSKAKLDKKHEYALIFMQETAVWARDFTSSPRDILVALEDIVDTHYCETCEASTLFDKLLEKVEIPKVEGDVSTLPPPYTVRVLFLYGRNNCPLQFQKQDSFKLLTSSPYFFLDALYIHEPQTEENKCQEVFDSVCDLDTSGLSYIHGASRNPTKLFDFMAQLLAHPLQRPLQEETAYRIGSSIPTPENG